MGRGETPWASQAAIDTLLRFGPQKSVLNQLVREAAETYGTTVRGAAGAAQETTQAIRGARPNVAAIYDNAGLGAQKHTGTLVGTDLSKLGAAADPYKEAAAVEQAGALANLVRGKTQALNQLSQASVQAKEGSQYAANQAGVSLRSTLGKISAKRQELAGEEGLYHVSDQEKLHHEAEKIEQQAQDRQQRERGSERSAGIDPNTGKPIPGGKLDKSTKPALSVKEQNQGFSTVYSIMNLARKYRAHAQAIGKSQEASRGHLVEILSEGVPSEEVGTGKTDASGKEVKQRTAAIPAYKPDVLMSAALDLAEYGYIQKGTQQRLARAGYKLEGSGLSTHGSPAPKVVTKTLENVINWYRHHGGG